MHTVYEMKFRRRFSITPYKSLRMQLGELSCAKNWVDDGRGAPYPAIKSSEREDATLSESLPGARYRAENRTDMPLMKARLLGQHFPYATYDVTLDSLTADGGSGMGVQIWAAGEDGSDYDCGNEPCLGIMAVNRGGSVCIVRTLSVGAAELPAETVESGRAFVPGMRLLVTSRGRFFDVYIAACAQPEYICTFAIEQMAHILRYNTFTRATAALLVSLQPGAAVQGDAEFYLDGGISHADIKCMRYENGMPIMKDGKLFMTMSARLQEGCYQIVCSWNPSTARIDMEGALFFDYGDGLWCSDVASTVVYNRRTDEWYVWACAFSHGHILCHAVSFADLRYGIHVLDAERMPVEQVMEREEQESLSLTSGGVNVGIAGLSDDTLFFGKQGDEDPDLIYDEERGKWQLIMCRLTRDGDGDVFRYFLFESDDPFCGYKYVDRTRTGNNTGGSIIRVAGRRYLLCGTAGDERNMYQLHPLDDLSQCTYMRFDYGDGGWRGWGQLIPVPCGRRTRYVWMTFDRHGGSSYTWSYGNIYVFEADVMNEGWEWADKPGLIR